MLTIDQLHQYLRSHNVATLCTSAAGGPHATPLFYVVLPLARMLWVSDPATLHGAHCALDAPVALAVAPSRLAVRDVEGVQLRGLVDVPDDQAALRSAYVERYAEAQRFIGPRHRFYVFTPRWARLIHVRDGARQRLEWRADVS